MKLWIFSHDEVQQEVDVGLARVSTMSVSPGFGTGMDTLDARYEVMTRNNQKLVVSNLLFIWLIWRTKFRSLSPMRPIWWPPEILDPRRSKLKRRRWKFTNLAILKKKSRRLPKFNKCDFKITQLLVQLTKVLSAILIKK